MGDTVFSLQHLTLCLRELGGREGEEEKSPEYKIVVNTFFSTYFVPITRVNISHIPLQSSQLLSQELLSLR